MQVTITQIRFGGLSVSKGVKCEVVGSIAQPDIIIPAEEVPAQVIPAHIADDGELVPEYTIPARTFAIGETVPEYTIAEHVDPLTSETVPAVVVPEHVAEAEETIPAIVVPEHLGTMDEVVPERIIPGYTIPEKHIAQQPVVAIVGHAWQYTCTMTAMPCTGSLPDFEEITGEARYVLENIFGFKTVTNYALELPMGPNGEEPSMQLLIGKFSQWFIGETQKMLATWVGKNITVGMGQDGI